MDKKEMRAVRTAKMMELYREGLSFREIGERVGLGKMGAWTAIKRELTDGAEPKRPPRPKSERTRKRPAKTTRDRVSDPSTWLPIEDLCMVKADQYWHLRWAPISAELFGQFIDSLTRTATEYTHVGGWHWSPTPGELAARLRVSTETVEDWIAEGVHEPWEIAVVRAYARSGMVLTSTEKRLSPETVRYAVARARNLEVASEITGIPACIMERHLVEGAPAGTHGRAYLLMNSLEYREFCRQNPVSIGQDRFLEIAKAMLAEGKKAKDIAAAIGITPSGTRTRLVRVGLISG